MRGSVSIYCLPVFDVAHFNFTDGCDAMLTDKTKRHAAGPRSISQPPEGRWGGGGGGDERSVTETSPPIRSSPQR